ncbi:hypothetical protein SCP_1303100 [Sparassis crispa]|uniref:Uncharacterized protein n=1 Tax=Sparassis crispa TaxID=139825 RepID=A0A401H253_9APHY|nr:hypothetical protein SCP_1303100 [Sparassis crispa]GBE88494.1 hypothetical protein SCP_1303100 [Sparassis crispa]
MTALKLVSSGSQLSLLPVINSALSVVGIEELHVGLQSLVSVTFSFSWLRGSKDDVREISNCLDSTDLHLAVLLNNTHALDSDIVLLCRESDFGGGRPVV